MKEFFKKPSNLQKIEFWAVTTIFVFAVFFLLTSGVGDAAERRTPNQHLFTEAGMRFKYYTHYFFPQLIRYITLYLTFLLLNFVIVPKLVRRESMVSHTIYTVLVMIGVGIVYGITDTYLSAFLFNNFSGRQQAYNYFFQQSFLLSAWLMLLFGFYIVIRYTGIYLLSRSEEIQSRHRYITPGGLVAFILWMLSMFILLIAQAEMWIVIVWGITAPFAIFFYWYLFHSVLPRISGARNPFRAYSGRVLLILVISLLPIGFLGLLLTNDPEGATAVSMFNATFQLFLTAPFTWVIYKRYIRGNQEVFALKQELGTAHASFDFLRSQINPHFLFNALNTIYGTALQEKAERTGEGIEKLGNMMRFMLQENMQDKISLAREIEYLENYIDLQKLRTDASPSIRIETSIQDSVNAVQIAPMLLIPFVENAFKHGISFREPSHIKVTLEMVEKSLYFDVSNSKHQKVENDPEKNKSGIGLSNVRHRLQLLYPKRHELIIRETAKDFYVHLTIRLS